jgi:hypothetical protein
VEYLAAAALIFGINLMPAFGPPTWSVLVFLRLNFELAAVVLVPIGALAAALGRLTLAGTTRRLRGHLPAKRLEGLAAAEEALTGSRAKSAAGLGLFALSPVPSAQLFIAAGLLPRVRLVPLTAAFFAGRLVSYSIYVGVASAAKESLGGIFAGAFSPLGIALQLLMLGALVALVRVDWLRLLAPRPASRISTEAVRVTAPDDQPGSQP